MMTVKSKRRRTADGLLIDYGENYTDKHQIFLQYLMHVHMAEKHQLSQIHTRLFYDEETLKESLEKITNKISEFRQDIKEIKSDLTGETYYVLYRTEEESVFTRCPPFNKAQLEFLKQIFNAIILSDSGQVGRIETLNMCKVLSKSEADEALEQFVTWKLLFEVGAKAYCLSPLSIVQFAPFFNSRLPDNQHRCDLCKQLVFIGKSCSGCSDKFHYHCVKKWVSRKSECPKCQTIWPTMQEESFE